MSVDPLLDIDDRSELLVFADGSILEITAEMRRLHPKLYVDSCRVVESRHVLPFPSGALHVDVTCLFCSQWLPVSRYYGECKLDGSFYSVQCEGCGPGGGPFVLPVRPNLARCPECGAATFIDTHNPASDQPILSTSRYACEECDWRSDEWFTPTTGTEEPTGGE